MQYVELHARSAFSFLSAASLPEALAYACVEHDLPAMALLDRNGVYGSARFHLTAKANNVRAHVGSEVSVAASADAPASYHPLLVQNRTGYQHLCRLITKTKLRAPKNTPTAATVSELEEHASGLVCLTGDEDGPLAQALRQGGKRQARRTLDQLISIFGRGNVYVELQRHFRPEQECRNHAAIDLARERKLPLVATNGILYAKPRTVRFSEKGIAEIESAAKQRGFDSPSAFIRYAVEQEISGRPDGLTGAEERLAANIEQVRKDVYRLMRVQQALFAYLDSWQKRF